MCYLRMNSKDLVTKNKSNFHTKKEKGDINTLHCEIFGVEKKQLISHYNKIKNEVQHEWF